MAREDRLRNNLDGYLFVTRNVLSRLEEMGVPEDTTTRITVDNPRRFFEDGS